MTSCFEGTRTIYRMSKGSKVSNGKPSIITMFTVPCGDETGITVTIPIEERDHYTIENIVKSLTYLGELNIVLNENLLPTMGMAMNSGSYLFSKEGNLSYCLSKVSNLSNSLFFVRYANILYPVPEVTSDVPDEYANVYNRLIGFRNLLNKHSCDVHYLIVQADPNTLSVQPSREGLTETEFTYSSLTTLMTNCVDDLESRLKSLIDIRYTSILNKLNTLLPSRFTDLALIKLVRTSITEGLTTKSDCIIHNTLASHVNNCVLTDLQKRKLYQELLKRSLKNQGISSDLSNYLTKIVKNNRNVTEFEYTQVHYRTGFLPKSFLYKWYRKLLTPELNHKRLYVYTQEVGTRTYRSDSNWLCSTLGEKVLKHPHYLTQFSNRAVILTTNLRKTTDRVAEYNRYYKDAPTLKGAMVYHVLKGKKNIEQARKALEDTGYVIYDFTKPLPWEKTYSTSTGTTQVSTPRITRNIKADSIPALSSILDEKGRIDTRLSCMGSAKRVEKPITNILVRINKNTPYSNVRDFGSSIFTKKVIELYGDQIGIVGTVVQKAKWDKVGNKDIYDLMVEHVINEFKKVKKEYIKVMSTSRKCIDSLEGIVGMRLYQLRNQYDIFTQQPIESYLPFKIHQPSQELKEFLALYDVVKGELQYRSKTKRETLETLLPDPVPSKAMVKFFTQLSHYPALHMYDLDELDSELTPEEILVVKHLISQIRKVKV